MKKWLLILLTVLLLFSGVLWAQAEGREDFVGYWVLDGLDNGDGYISHESLSFTVIISIREDDTMVFCLKDTAFMIKPVTFQQDAEGWCCKAPDIGDLTVMRIDDQGRLYCALINGGRMDVWMRRTQPPGDPVVGSWTIDHAYRDGEYQSRDMLRDISMEIGADQFGVLRVNAREIPVYLYIRDGELIMMDDNGDLYPARMGEDGDSLSFDLVSTEETSWTLGLVRVPAAPAGAAPATPQPTAAPQAPAAAPTGYDGMWTVTAVLLNGMEMDAQTMGVSGTLRVMGESARYTVGDVNALGVVTLMDTGLTVSCRDAEYVFVMDDAGTLLQTVQGPGLTMTLCFTRQP